MVEILNKKVGLVCKKLGMTSYVLENGEMLPATMVKVLVQKISGHKVQEDQKGYKLIQVEYNIKETAGGEQKNRKKNTSRYITYKVAPENIVSADAGLNTDIFQVGQLVDVSATTKGKGFAGGMKRHGFSGLRASHGVSATHRSLGSTGQRQDPGRVFKGKKMAGHMGFVNRTIQNIEVLEINNEENLLILKGSIPGNTKDLCVIKNAVKES